MGKQLAFYMVDQDEDEFIQFIRSTGDVLILPQTSENERGEEFTSFRDLAGRKLGEACHLWNRSLSPITTINYFPVHGGCYCVDFMQSEVVNVMRSKRVDNELSKGRVHIENMVLRPDGTVAEKRPDFVKWFTEICRWIKKRYAGRFDGACVSSRADALAKNGTELTGHRF
jgi:hypothetical protein